MGEGIGCGEEEEVVKLFDCQGGGPGGERSGRHVIRDGVGWTKETGIGTGD